MEVIFGIDNISPFKERSYVTIGNFDGYHKGHKLLVEKVQRKAIKGEGKSVLITFFPHPQSLFVSDFKIVNSLEVKIEKLRKTGVDYLIIIPFTHQFSNISAFEFVQDILIDKLNCKGVVIGYDFAFGKKGEGNGEFLKKYQQFSTEVVEAVTFNGLIASSTVLRKALLDGDIALYNNISGDYPLYTGVVVKGLGLGKKFGFATANFYLPSNLLFPKKGVYAVKVIVGTETFSGVANFGTKPTIGSNKLVVEVHIFGLEENLYGKKITLKLIQFLREEKQFCSKQKLITQVNEDIIRSKEILC
ncbi:bifunctional riboflavin kinase/FAD synthetase [Proteinivorax tanatarense]|uniref:Riboflavin biosynthesis protein n=1 Tax=Proteinivorax tanatarense TaxID=1260629 RepID=A0AAU7VQR4_9FIRM